MKNLLCCCSIFVPDAQSTTAASSLPSLAAADIWIVWPVGVPSERCVQEVAFPARAPLSHRSVVSPGMSLLLLLSAALKVVAAGGAGGLFDDERESSLLCSLNELTITLLVF